MFQYGKFKLFVLFVLLVCSRPLTVATVIDSDTLVNSQFYYRYGTKINKSTRYVFEQRR